MCYIRALIFEFMQVRKRENMAISNSSCRSSVWIRDQIPTAGTANPPRVTLMSMAFARLTSKDQGENDIAEAAGDPDGDKEKEGDDHTFTN